MTIIPGTKSAPYIELRDGIAEAKGTRNERQTIIKLIQTYWMEPGNSAARAVTPNQIADHVVSLASSFIGKADFAVEIVEQGMKTHPAAWDALRAYLADKVEAVDPIDQNTRDLLIWILRNERPTRMGRKPKTIHHRDLQLARAVWAVHSLADYSLDERAKRIANSAFQIVADATRETFDVARDAYGKYEKAFKKAETLGSTYRGEK